jgi:hypothetical protein
MTASLEREGVTPLRYLSRLELGFESALTPSGVLKYRSSLKVLASAL